MLRQFILDQPVSRKRRQTKKNERDLYVSCLLAAWELSTEKPRILS